MWYFLLLYNDTEYKMVLNCSKLNALRLTHTKRQAERQASRQAARSHRNALWRSKMGPRSIPKRQGERHNVTMVQWDLAAWRSVCLHPKNGYKKDL